MKYYVDLAKEEFAYIQLYKQMKRDIIDGVLLYGTKLPSKRLLAEETGVSVITIEHTYSILCDEGYIEARQRSGYFVIYREGDFCSTDESVGRGRDEYDGKSEFDFLDGLGCLLCWLCVRGTGPPHQSPFG